jgi:hypothetical protein
LRARVPEVRRAAADLAAWAGLVPDAETLHLLFADRPHGERDELLYVLVSLQVALTQAAGWLRRLDGGVTRARDPESDTVAAAAAVAAVDGPGIDDERRGPC